MVNLERDYIVYVKTYDGCQLNCSHCMTNGKNGTHQNGLRINIDEAIDWSERLIRKALDNAYDENSPWVEIPNIHFEFHGGEPLLGNIQEMIKLAKSLKEHGCVTIGITSNFVLKLTDEIMELLSLMDGIGTSWDNGIRFENKSQEKLWLNNVQTINSKFKAHKVLNISLSKSIINTDIGKLLLWIYSLGFNDVSFERITYDGLAILNQDNIIPSNQEINQFYLRLHDAARAVDFRKYLYITNLEDVYSKFERSNNHSGTFCRDCESKIFTINPDGTIGGCPNSASVKTFGHMSDNLDSLFESPKRVIEIVNEQKRNPICYDCEVFDICTGDCHQLKWQGHVCPAPRDLMIKLKKEYNK